MCRYCHSYFTTFAWKMRLILLILIGQLLWCTHVKPHARRVTLPTKRNLGGFNLHLNQLPDFNTKQTTFWPCFLAHFSLWGPLFLLIKVIKDANLFYLVSMICLPSPIPCSIFFDIVCHFPCNDTKEFVFLKNLFLSRLLVFWQNTPGCTNLSNHDFLSNSAKDALWMTSQRIFVVFLLRTKQLGYSRI